MGIIGARSPELIPGLVGVLLSGAAATWPQLATLRSNEGTLEIAAGASLTTATAPGQVFTNSGQLTLNGASLSVPDAATLNPAGTFTSYLYANPAAAGSTGRLTSAGALTVGRRFGCRVRLRGRSTAR